ncbi:hypothetical protein ACFY8F_35215 [Streptomyces tanashiensis]|uniref:hypothetical protein n=1 Tax=Streptomyces tanashiensis TaxID=67367 RepID=UPI00369AB082
MLDVIRYLADSGTKWRAMPADFPPWDRSTRSSGAGATTIWSASSTTDSAAWSASGRDSEPGAGVIDSQSVKRKRSLALTAVASTAAS